jgi:hydrogenase expression/formation protein HypC
VIAGPTMCLGIPGQVVEVLAEHEGQLGLVDVQGARRRIDLGLLNLDQEALSPGDWVLIHMGFALERIDGEAAAETLAGLELMGRPEP